MYRGIVVFDVDGVIFKDIFLRRVVQSKGLKNYIKILLLGMRYYREKINIQSLLKEGYKLAENFSVKKAQNIANEIKRITNIKETVKLLHQNNYYVSLISAGIPDFILKGLAYEIKADHHSGLEIELKEGAFDVEKIKVTSKVEIVERLIKELGLGWDHVISVGDDPGNIELLKKSRIGIGFNPIKTVRESADIVVDGNDFLEIIPYIIPTEKLPSKFSISRYSWKREIFRKGVHLLGCVLPFLARLNESLTLYLLLSVIAIYFLSELSRNIGLSLSLFSHITRSAQRHSEKKGIILGPILLGLGIAATIAFFQFEIYMPAILIVSISDSLSALIGKRFGKIHIFKLKNRTIEGSLAFFFSTLLILSLLFPFKTAISATIVSTILELVPVYNLDNLLIPVGTALFLWLLRI